MRIHPGVLLAILVLAPGAARAADKPLVQVGFSVAEPLYQQRLSDAEQAAIEQRIAQFLLTRLQEDIPFLAFGPGQADSYRLRVSLGQANAPKVPHDVRFVIDLIAPDGRKEGSKVWGFRGRATWDDAIGGPEVFEREIRARLSQLRLTDLVPGVLERVPVTQEGTSIPLPEVKMAWILPFLKADLCLGPGSAVSLATEIETSFNPNEPRQYRAIPTVYLGSEKPEHRGRVLCLPESQQDLTLLENRTPDQVRVKKVFVTTYSKPAEGCFPAPASPEAVASSLGGER